jgi:hypothetical protein
MTALQRVGEGIEFGAGAGIEAPNCKVLRQWT